MVRQEVKGCINCCKCVTHNITEEEIKAKRKKEIIRTIVCEGCGYSYVEVIREKENS